MPSANRGWAAAALAAALLSSCSDREARGHAEPAVSPERAPAAAPPPFSPPVEPPLGVDSLASLRWSERAGHAAFRLARAAERRGQWAQMVGHCQSALAADPSHLEASWLLAAGLVHLGRHAEVGEPLARAVAGEPGKWGAPALTLPLFAPYWESGQGALLRPWIEEVLRRYQTELASSLVAVYRDRLVAYQPRTGRYVALARPHRVRGALVVPPRVAFMTGAAPGERGARLGILDLRSSVVKLEPLPEGRHELWLEPAGDAALVRSERGRWRSLGGEQVAQPQGVLAPRLAIRGARAMVDGHPAPDLSADWDQDRMASALRLRRSQRVLVAPAPAMIDGQRVAWSPRRTRLAFVAADSACLPEQGARVAAYVADALTGAPRLVSEAPGALELGWVDEQLLAVGSARGVALYALGTDGAATVRAELPELTLPAAAPRPRCPAAEAPVVPAEDPDEL